MFIRIFIVMLLLVPGFVVAQETAKDDVSFDSDGADDIDGLDPGASYNQESDVYSNWSFHSPYYFDGFSKKIKAKNTIKVGFTHASGNTRSYAIGAQETLVLLKGKFVNTFKAGVYYGQSASSPNVPLAETNRFFFVKTKPEWHVSDKTYVFGNLGWYSNKPSGYKNNTRLAIGLGRFFVETDKHVFRVEVGYHFNHEDIIDPVQNNSLNSGLVGLRYAWFINDWTSWDNEFEMIENIEDFNNVKLNFSTEIDFRIVKHLYLGLGFKVMFDNRPAYPGVKKLDTNLMATILFHI